MVISWTCKFWLEFWLCVREILYPAGNAAIPSGIGLGHTSEGNPSSHCPLDREEKWKIEDLVRNGWKGCWEWLWTLLLCHNLWIYYGNNPGIPLVPTAHPGNALSPFSLSFPSNQDQFPCQEPLWRLLGSRFFQGRPAGNWKAFPGHSPELFPVPFAGKSKGSVPPEPGCFKWGDSHFFAVLTPKVPPWMCPGSCAGIVFPGFPWFRAESGIGVRHRDVLGAVLSSRILSPEGERRLGISPG